MQSLIISSSDKDKIKKQLDKIINQNKIGEFDITNIELTGSMGIETIRIMQKSIYLLPSSGKKKAVVLHDAENLTIEAQNSLLKILEEPPEHTIIILLAKTASFFLSTVLSRCALIRFDGNDSKNPILKESDYKEIIETIASKDTGKLLKLSQDISKTREEAADFLEQSILGFRQIILNSILTKENDLNYFRKEKLMHVLYALQNTHKIIKTTNANARLILENMFLNIKV